MINLRAKEAERAAQMFLKRKEPDNIGNEGEDMFFDAKEYHTSNRQVANILTSAPSETIEKKQHTPAVNVENAKWGDEEEIDIDDELLEQENGEGAIHQE